MSSSDQMTLARGDAMITQRSIRHVMLSVLLLAPASAFAYGPNVCDFDGDGKADLTIVRNDAGNNKLDWWVLQSGTGTVLTFPWGLSSDFSAPSVLLCGDFDGDGKADATVWRSGATPEFWVRFTAGGVSHVPFGLAGDDPTVVNDFDGDGIDDFAIWRSSTTPAQFWVRRSSDGTLRPTSWGTGSTDFPHAQDFDGDGKADLYAERSGPSLTSTSQNWILNSATGTVTFALWGLAADIYSPLNYSGPNRADISAIRNNGTRWIWYTRDTATGSPVLPPLYALSWGLSATSLLVPADYDGDGQADPTVWFPATGQWWTRQSTDTFAHITTWGISGDKTINGFAAK
jgi:hypothetical protein